MRVQFLNSNIDNLTMNETLTKIDTIIKKGKPVQHVVVNANKINLMQKDLLLRSIVNSSELINADGASILLAGKLLGKPVVERVTGIDLFCELLIKCETNGYRPYFLGATKETIKTLIRTIREDYPKIDIAGYRDGYFTENESEDIAAEISATNAAILFVGFSSPQKEYWINKHLEQMNVPFVMGVGGSFDVLAGKTKRAPDYLQKIGMEWFYRFAQEPRRMFKRYFVGNLLFVYYTLKEKIGMNR